MDLMTNSLFGDNFAGNHVSQQKSHMQSDVQGPSSKNKRKSKVNCEKKNLIEKKTKSVALQVVPWNKEEDKKLEELVALHGNKWTLISELMHQSRERCSTRWHGYLKWTLSGIEFIQGCWTLEEDQNLRDVVNSQIRKPNQPIPWKEVAKSIPGRSEKQCRARWEDHLSDSYSKGPLTPAEIRLITRLAHDKNYKIIRSGWINTDWVKITQKNNAEFAKQGIMRSVLKVKNCRCLKFFKDYTASLKAHASETTSTPLAPVVSSSSSSSSTLNPILWTLRPARLDSETLSALALKTSTMRSDSQKQSSKEIPKITLDSDFHDYPQVPICFENLEDSDEVEDLEDIEGNEDIFEILK